MKASNKAENSYTGRINMPKSTISLIHLLFTSLLPLMLLFQ